MASTQKFFVGSVVRVPVVFRTSAGAQADPGTIQCKYRDPAGATVTKSASWNGTALSGDPEIVREAMGNYRIDIDATQPGVWSVRWAATNGLVAAWEGTFTVQPTAF